MIRRRVRILAVTTFCAAMATTVPAQDGAVGWYNGDWQSGIPGLLNWYQSNIQFARVYDDFVVPQGGWVVVGVFSNNNMYEFPAVRNASWEIRRDMRPRHGGKVVASGRAKATQTLDTTAANVSKSLYRVEVRGLHVKLPAGRYWLSVSPVGVGQSFLCATRGANAVGDPGGNNGGALVYEIAGPAAELWNRRDVRDLDPRVVEGAVNAIFEQAEAVGQYGKGLGVGKDFSQGVIVGK